MSRLFKSKKAQGATEYIMILAILVALVLFVGNLMKKKMPGVVGKVFDKITGGINSTGDETPPK